MKKFLILFSLYVIGGSASALPSFDPFADATDNGGTSYGVGDNLIGQNNSTLFSPWYSRGSVSGSSVQPTIVAGSLTHPDMPPSTGNSVSFVGAAAQSACLHLNLPTQHTNTVYCSFLLKLTDLSAVSTSPTNNPFAAFLDDPSALPNNIGRLGSRIVTKKVGTSGYVLGVSRSATPADFAYEDDSAAHSVNDVLYVVVSYQRAADVQTNVNLWINPPPSSLGSNAPPPPTLVATAGTTALNGNNARAFGILCQFTGAPTGVIDDVRVATNDWAYVTGGDPAITQNPADQTLPQGANASFTVVARGTPTLSYQWVKDGTTALNDGGNISGANTATLHVNNISPSDVGSYEVFVTNGLGSFVQSASAQLALADPAITSQPQSRTNDFGTTATFSVSVSGTAPFTYQWRKEGVDDLGDGGNISGSHSNVLTLTGVTLADAGNYSVTVSNAVGAAMDSATAVLTVNDPAFVVQPVSVTNNVGSNVTFHVVVDGTGAPSFIYQWRKNGNPIFDEGNVSGTLTDTLSISNITSADEAFYSVEVIGASTVTSKDASLTVINPVSISAQPSPRTVIAGSTTVFAVGIIGTPPIAYQWLFQGTNIPGGTSFAYTVTNAQAAVAGGYSVVVSNSLNTVTSSVAALTITPDLHLFLTNLVVIRIGSGAQTLALNGNSMFLDQFATDGTYVQTLAIPDTGASGMIGIGLNNVNVTSGSVTASGLTRSADGRFMVAAGYNTSLGYGGNLNDSTAVAVPRGIGLIDSQAQYDLAVSSTNSVYSQTFWRAAVTDGTNNFWGAAGAGGTYYFGFDAAPETVQSQFVNVRGMAVFNGSIYCAGAVSGNNGILKLDGMPTTSAAANPTLLFAASTGTSDMEVSPNGNLIYVADDRAIPNGGVQRWEFNGSIWSMTYTLNTGLGDAGARYVTADFSGPEPVVYAITKEVDNNRIVAFVDAGAGSLGNTLASAGVNQTFRGIRFGPIENTVVAQPTLGFSSSGNNLILDWTGAFFLQSATNVTGPYGDISGASSPYTNNTSELQRYFRLRN